MWVKICKYGRRRVTERPAPPHMLFFARVIGCGTIRGDHLTRSSIYPLPCAIRFKMDIYPAWIAGRHRLTNRFSIPPPEILLINKDRREHTRLIRQLARNPNLLRPTTTTPIQIGPRHLVRMLTVVIRYPPPVDFGIGIDPSPGVTFSWCHTYTNQKIGIG